VRAVLRRSVHAPARDSSAPEPVAGPSPSSPQGRQENPAAGALRNRPRANLGTVPMGDRTLDLDRQKLFGPDGAEIDVSAGEFDLLALFARNPNRPLKRDVILAQAHDRGWDVFDRSIDLRIMRLRRKLERNPDKPEVIKTVRGVGYVFVASQPD
jgi:DNA-binding response OmpR family regulator